MLLITYDVSMYDLHEGRKQLSALFKLTSFHRGCLSG